MAGGPESAFWRTMRQNLPNGSFAERVENRHGGGFVDVLLFWSGLVLFIELKAPKAMPDSWFHPYTENNFLHTDGFAEYIPARGAVFSSKILRPSQSAFHARANAAGVPTFILARPLSSRAMHLFCPIRGAKDGIRGPAAPLSEAPAAPVRGPRPEDSGPAAPLPQGKRPADGLVAGKLSLEDSPAAPDSLRLAEIGGFRRWPDVFSALRTLAQGQPGGETGP